MCFPMNPLTLARAAFLTTILVPLLGTALAADKPVPVTVKDGWYFLDGRKTFLNALGCEPGARPGEGP